MDQEYSEDAFLVPKSTPQNTSRGRKYLRQMRVVLQKNVILATRNWKLTAMQFGCPVLFILLLFLMGLVPQYGGPIGNQPQFDITSIPPCYPGKEFKTCFSFMFGPSDDPVAQQIINITAESQGLEVVYLDDFGGDINQVPINAVVGMKTFQELEEFILTHQNFTQSVVFFNHSVDYDSDGLPMENEDDDPTIPLDYRSTWNVSYEIWYNATCINALINPSIDLATYTDPVATCPDIRPQLQLAVDCAIFEYLLDNVTDLPPKCDASLQSYYWANLGVNDTVQTYGVLFFFCAMMFVYVVLIYQVVYEKDKNLKLGMQLMGLRESVFWVSWFVTAFVTSVIVILLVMMTGYILQFAFFWETSFLIVFITFFLFSLAMIGLSLFVSVLVGSAKQAISIGMFLYIVGVLVQIFLGNQDFVAFVYDKDLLASKILRPFFFIYPPFNFAKVVLSISNESFDYGTYKGDGYSWSNLGDQSVIAGDEIPSDLMSWVWQMIDCVIYYTLAWYLANVLPSDTSSGSPPWFFVLPSYWGFTNCSPKEHSSRDGYSSLMGPEEKVERDSYHKSEMLADELTNARPAIQIQKVKKVHFKYPFGIRSNEDVLAVNGLDLTINEGELFCLLGHNGAGKTTTINMLTGLYEPTEGTISVFDKDVVTELEEVRAQIGICPQHDILWLEMTAEEHLYLYSRLKNLPEEEVPETVEHTLRHVNLLHKKDIRSSSFSGGMKRRLSVAISSIGDPKVIFMDEPTTGMDPKSRQQVWKMIEELKAGRVIIMTTHSMEEAEILADRVGIMASGSLRCCGTSLYLKSNFGTGYKLTVMVGQDRVDSAQAQIAKWFPNCQLVTVSGGQLTFSLQNCGTGEMIQAIRSLEALSAIKQKEEEMLFKDWGISQSGLEEVFLSVTGHDAAAQSNVITYDD